MSAGSGALSAEDGAQASPAANAFAGAPETTRDEAVSRRAMPPGYARLTAAILNDARDWPFLWVSLSRSIVIATAIALFALRSFPWWMAAVHLALVLGLADRFILMLHNTSHRPPCSRRFRALNHFIPWILGPFYGESPQSYFVHHVGMHHPEHNMEADLSSTIRYQRDSVFAFLHYFFRFLFFGIFELAAYLHKRGRRALLRKILVGELSYYAVVAALAAYSWQATLVVFVAPLLIVRFLMMAGNWGQHAFVDPVDPGNSYKNSLTCIDSRYNWRCFNDGYHIGHHLKATMHWSELPGELAKNRADYAANGSLVLSGTDFFMVWAMLMTKQHARIAAHHVHVGSGPKPTRSEVTALLHARLRPVQVRA